jgi:hypothetical protein
MKKQIKLLLLLFIAAAIFGCNHEASWISSGLYVYDNYGGDIYEDAHYKENLKMLKSVTIEIDTDAGTFTVKQPGKDKIVRKLSGSYWVTSCQPNDVDIEHCTVLGGPLKLSDTMILESPMIFAAGSSCKGGDADGITLFDQQSKTITFDDGSSVQMAYFIDFKLKNKK